VLPSRFERHHGRELGLDDQQRLSSRFSSGSIPAAFFGVADALDQALA